MRHKILFRVGVGVLAVAVAGGAAAAWWVNSNLDTAARQLPALRSAGYVDHVAEINGGQISYTEGPNNGPALLLIHGQLVDKFNYAPVLPELAKRYHVFAVDCYGHGSSSHDPSRYTTVAHGRDYLAFIKQVIGSPVLLSGHSSGGIISSWLAANADGLVRGVLFEDPPFLTLTLPRAKSTWNWYDLATSAHGFLASGESDWTGWQLQHMRLWDFFGDSKKMFVDRGLAYHASHPGEPIQEWMLPSTMNEMLRPVPAYDPRFGEAFYTGTWNDGFDVEATLRAIKIPVFYERSKVTLSKDGILMGATSDEESAKARSLMSDVAYGEDDSSHSWHWSKPNDFIARIDELRTRVGA